MRYSFTIRLASWLILAPLTQSTFQNDFSLYPESAQQCLYTAATLSGCSGDTAMAMNSCLCSNGGNFVTKTATCLESLDAVELGTVYDTMNDHCTDTKTPLTVSRAQFLKDRVANVASTTTSATASGISTSISTGSMTATTTGSAAVTSTGDPEATGSGENNSGDEEGDGDGTLSSTARAGIIAGSTSGGVLILGLMAFLFVRHRRNSQSSHEEAHPMLFQKFGGHSGGGGFDAAAARQGDVGGGGVDLSATAHDGLEVADAHGLEETVPVSDQKWRPNRRFNWESPYEPPWSPPLQDAAPKPGWGQLPRVAAQSSREGYRHIEPQIHELASPELQAPIEMAATPLDGQQYSGSGWGSGK
ncbi:hypothetical protein CONLIGDRAFT_368937 [Coniochaeta ligniaria NRRL 30616]|uniref:Extracellular membrane protein CFEM domain-containing protein n=1 Tax=Coniochaeta ligniaria NRRL 30616 TaxID=1408157 RepID=A0A1J7JEU7_9PEZI|nr:hypothetical protein CONLIGDRAFT_368937 [Coniochaeta ligniaria NRRL 30616]